ncbi:MAG: uracil-DNA glycosylase family protein [Candidatus Limnocylindria bacterium]
MDDASEPIGSATTLGQIADAVRVCTRCPLSTGRTLAVPGEGNVESDVLLVGEGPGAREDRTGRPFVGPAGELLSELLAAIGWERGDVFITNVVKCRPPGNRDPEPAEKTACAPYLDAQEQALQPAIVVTLGRHSLQRYLPGSRIGAIHGQMRRSYGGQHIFPMYHPAAALHQASLRETLLRDIRGLPAALLDARRALENERSASVQAQEARQPELDPDAVADDAEQMTLF